MNDYEQKAYEEVQAWKRKLLKRSNLIKRVSKKAQDKINEKIPEKVHSVITDSIKNMVKMTVAGSSFTTKMEMARNLSLEEREKKLVEKIAVYQKTATVEGAGTGAGGILLGLADFPLLLSIKMKFLFEAAAVYGFDTKEYEERLFILHIFQLAFSSDEKRKETLQIVENWEERIKEIIDMDWQQFQQEYRDYIDFVKMLQLLPGIGAVVGAYANYNLMEHLGEVAKNAYRIRILANAPRLY
ncbi:ABC transporter-associated protein EcsC [Robertmurraya siralis]|uniref:ABC transporter-associated protein EcsC n=1 Tax=Robertmurraya siralis TaxID=77777 RepID=A0A919WJJ9_9BACI|nr:EcsC family protein [Robertmurraya siralis]PAE20735.1 ABC transporter-associated protein EcsC [Bacillus sp. 7504-2]GIN62862.1 ABC transporter-associated protein EcsC [Robertmurraya siralis]